MKVKKHCSRLLALIYVFTLLIPMNTVKAAEDYVTATKTVDMAKMTTEQEATVTLTVKGAPPVNEIKPNDVILIIDKSGSMANGYGGCNYYKMDAARTAAQTFLDVMDMTTHKVGIVDFSSIETTKEVPLTHDAAALKTYISQIKEGGGTSTGDAVRRATRMLANHRPEAQPVIIILTDGEASDAGSTPLQSFNNAKQAAQEAKAAGIVFYTLALLNQGVNDATSEPSKVMKEMATTAEHHYFAYSTDQLEEKYRSIEQQIKKPSIYNVKLKDVVSPEFEIVPGSADNNIPRPTIVGNEISWNLTEIKEDTLNFTYKIRPKKDIAAGTYKVSSETYATYTDYTNADRRFDIVNPSIEVEHPAPIINTIEANNGEIVGGNVVTIKGDKFRLGATVTFGGNKATNVTVVSETEIKAVVPVGVVGNVQVKVINNDGKSAETSYRYWANPTVNTITPQHGKLEGNTKVVIKGTNFAKDIKVKFGNKEAIVTYKDSTELTVYTPVAEISGTVDITLTNGDGTTLTVKDGFTYDVEYATPIITSIEKDNGETIGGNEVTIKGDKFREGATVTFGSSNATNIRIVSETEIKAIVPAGLRGNAVVKVSNEDGKFAQTNYRYWINPVVTSIEPNHGPLAGNTKVAIKGNYFMNDIKVNFGTKSASKIEYVNATLIYAYTPEGGNGEIVDVVLTNGDGTTVSVLKGYTYDFEYPAPIITSIEKDNGETVGGNEVTIKGDKFREGATVTFGTSNATNIRIVSETEIKAIVPAGLRGTVIVKVSNSDKKFAQTNYRYWINPIVTSIEANHGPLSGQFPVAIRGNYFMTDVKVKFGTMDATSIIYKNPSLIYAYVPVSVTSGDVDVVVTNGDASSVTVTNGFKYDGLPKPTIVAVTPAFGEIKGGNIVTINGTLFQTGTAVKFGAVVAKVNEYVNATTIKVVVPQGASVGTVDITVTNPNNEYAVLTNAYSYTEPQIAKAPSITSISPNEGKISGGYSVTIEGSDFKTGATVKFGAMQATILNFLSENKIIVNAPKGSIIGPVDVAITNPDNQQGTLASGFTYKEDPKGPAPTITNISLSKGYEIGGEMNYIRGTNFTKGTKIKFGDNYAPLIEYYNSTYIKVKVPAGNLGTVDFVIENPDEQTATLKDAYTYYEVLPQIVSLTANSGVITGGYTVGIKLLNYGSNVGITVDGVSVVARRENATSVLITMPAGKEIGAVDIVVTDIAKGKANTITFTYLEKPKALPIAITSLSVTSGSVSGNQIIYIRGSRFTKTMKIMVDGVQCPIVEFYNNTYVKIKSPAHSAGVVDVVILNVDDVPSNVVKFEYK